MNVLASSKTFKEKYSKRAFGLGGVAAGLVTASGIAGTAATAASVAATQASAWTICASWPLIGSFCAGKAAAVGFAAGTAALGSAAVLAPAMIAGGGVAYVIYRNKKKRSLHKCTGIESLAHAFASVALLPMLGLAVSVCKSNPINTKEVTKYLIKELGAWGYSEAYVRNVFDNAMRLTPEEINRRYDQSMHLLASGSTEGIGTTPKELPYKEVRKFAEDFRKGFEACMAA